MIAAIQTQLLAAAPPPPCIGGRAVQQRHRLRTHHRGEATILRHYLYIGGALVCQVASGFHTVGILVLFRIYSLPVE